MPYVHNRFEFSPNMKRHLKTTSFVWGYSLFSQVNYYQNYSRNVDGVQETWQDTAIRVIEGMLSIRKDHYLKNGLRWDEPYWTDLGVEMCIDLIRQIWSPAGRGLWSMGTDLVYDRGAMPLYNCAYTDITKDWVDDIIWLTDTIMLGVGVGFGPARHGLQLVGAPSSPHRLYRYSIPDTREGWVESIRLLLRAHAYGGEKPVFDYSGIRPEGAPLKTFGGVASGPKPLMDFHDWIDEWCDRFRLRDMDEIQFQTDMANCAGVCMITGNMRRGAEIGVSTLDDPVFKELKDYYQYPERKPWGWMSNNTVKLETDEDFLRLDEIAAANIAGKDIGFMNMRNIPYARVGKSQLYVRRDPARGLNPCGEVPLEHREVCNVGETCPTRCRDEHEWFRATRATTTYCSTVALLPTHQPTTNAVIARNRRIGVSIVDFQGWLNDNGTQNVTNYLRTGYDTVRETNHTLADEAGVPRSIRLTTMKPGGTVPKVFGRNAGASLATFEYIKCRVNVRKNTNMDRLLEQHGVPYEESIYTPDTARLYSFPLYPGNTRAATEVSIWEQAMCVMLLQREWADNAVSNTIYFKPRWVTVKIVAEDCIPGENERVWTDSFDRRLLQRYNPDHEEDDLANMLAHIAPHVKSISLLPHSDVGIFPQMPQEGITYKEYSALCNDMPDDIDWSAFVNDYNVESDKYCSGGSCDLPVPVTR